MPVQQAKRPKQEESAMETDDLVADTDFLQSVLENLPGVDRNAVDSLNKDEKKDDADKK